VFRLIRSPDHGERHLEGGGGGDGMGYSGREDDGLPRGHAVFLPADGHPALPVERGEDRIEWCGVLGEPLPRIEGEEGDASRRVGDDHPEAIVPSWYSTRSSSRKTMPFSSSRCA